MASNKGRKLNNWNASPETILLKVVLHYRWRKNSDKASGILWFWKHFPLAQKLFKHPLTDAAVWGRAFTPAARGKSNECIEVNKFTKPYTIVEGSGYSRGKFVLKLCDEGKIFSLDDLRFYADLGNRVRELPERELPEDEPEDEKGLSALELAEDNLLAAKQTEERAKQGVLRAQELYDREKEKTKPTLPLRLPRHPFPLSGHIGEFVGKILYSGFEWSQEDTKFLKRIHSLDPALNGFVGDDYHRLMALMTEYKNEVIKREELYGIRRKRR